MKGEQLKVFNMLHALINDVANCKYGRGDLFQVTPFLNALDDATDFLDEQYMVKKVEPQND